MAFEEFDRQGTNDPLKTGGEFQNFRVPQQFQGAPLPQLSPNQPESPGVAPDIFNPNVGSMGFQSISPRNFATPSSPANDGIQTFDIDKSGNLIPPQQATPTPDNRPLPAFGFNDFTQPSPQDGSTALPVTPQDGNIASSELNDILLGMQGKQTQPSFPGAPAEGIGGNITPEQRAQAALMIRQAKQETTIRESGAKSAKEKIARSLREQGITEEAIKNDPRFKDAKTEQEKFKAVSAIQKRETLKRVSTERDQKVMSRLTSKEKRNEDGTAKNDAAVAVDFDNFFSDFGPDPSGEDKPNIDFLTPSQRKEFNRVMNEASRGRVSDAKFKRIAKFQRDIEAKRDRAFDKSEQKKVDDALTLAAKRVQTTEDNTRITAIKASLSEIKSRLADKNSKTKPTNEEKKAFREQRKELSDALASFVGGTPDPVTDEQIKATIPDATPAELVEIRKGLANGFTLEQMAAK